jgi:hypothetical protein
MLLSAHKSTKLLCWSGVCNRVQVGQVGPKILSVVNFFIKVQCCKYNHHGSFADGNKKKSRDSRFDSWQACMVTDFYFLVIDF